MPLELYGTRSCPYTAELRSELQWDGKPFVEYDVEADAGARRRLFALVSGAGQRAGARRRRAGHTGRLERSRLLRSRRTDVIEARHVRITGIVQGVGFRPFVYRLARAHGLHGWVLNAETGVEIHVEGAPSALPGFLGAIESQAPAASRIASFDIVPTLVSGFDDFTIRESVRTSRADGARLAGFAGLRGLLARNGRPERPPLRLPVHKLHQLWAALQHHSRFAVRPSADDDARLADVRALCCRISRSARPPLSRSARCMSRLRAIVLFDGRRRHASAGTRRSLAPQRCCARVRSSRSKVWAATIWLATQHSPRRSRALRERKYRKERPFAVMTRDLESAAALVDLSPEARAPAAIHAAADRAGSGKG